MADPLSILFNRTPSRQSEIGSVIVDATISENHQFSAEVTDHPIETGGFVTDHAYLNPRVVTVQGEVTDTPVVIFSALTGLTNRSSEAFERLRQIYESRDIVTLVTGLDIYTDMVMDRLDFNRTQTTGKRLQFTASFKQITKVSSQIVGVSNENVNPENQDIASSNRETGSAETLAPQESAAAESAAAYELLLSVSKDREQKLGDFINAVSGG